MNHGESKVVRIEKAKGKQMLFLSLSIIMVLILLLVGLGASSTFLKIIMILCALFFALGIWFFTKSLLNKTGFAILDEHGFYEYSSAMSTNDTLIPWKEVKKLTLRNLAVNVMCKCYSIILKLQTMRVQRLEICLRKAMRRWVMQVFLSILILLKA